MDHKPNPRFDSEGTAPKSGESAVRNLTFDRKPEPRKINQRSFDRSPNRIRGNVSLFVSDSVAPAVCRQTS